MDEELKLSNLSHRFCWMRFRRGKTQQQHQLHSSLVDNRAQPSLKHLVQSTRSEASSGGNGWKEKLESTRDLLTPGGAIDRGDPDWEEVTV